MNNFSVPMNDLSRSLRNDRKVIHEAIDEVIDSGYLVLGSQVENFEIEVSRLLGVDYGIGVANGTDAIELAIRSSVKDKRTRILTAANAGTYSSIAIKSAGHEIVYADVEIETHSISLDTVKAQLNQGIGAVIVTHLYGLATDITSLVSFCRSEGIVVLEDCSQAIGAQPLPNLFAGSMGDVSAISLYPTKNLGALGDGGIAITDNSEIADNLRSLRQYGWGRKYHVEKVGGFNSRLDEIQAAILRKRLNSLHSANDKRRSILKRYNIAATGTRLSFQHFSGNEHVGHLAICFTQDRPKALLHFDERRIATDIHFPLPDYKQVGFIQPILLPNTEYLSERIFTLPCFPEMSAEEIDYVCEAISDFK